MTQAIGAYREVVVSPEFRELERLRADARHNEASAVVNAMRKAERIEREKWQEVVAEKDAALSENAAALSEKDAALSEKDAALSEKDAALSEKDAEIALLRAMLNGK